VRIRRDDAGSVPRRLGLDRPAVREAPRRAEDEPPLGLMYVPFVAADMQLVGAPPSTGRPSPPPVTF
jgi:hypothetical protein